MELKLTTAQYAQLQAKTEAADGVLLADLPERVSFGEPAPVYNAAGTTITGYVVSDSRLTPTDAIVTFTAMAEDIDGEERTKHRGNKGQKRAARRAELRERAREGLADLAAYDYETKGPLTAPKLRAMVKKSRDKRKAEAAQRRADAEAARRAAEEAERAAEGHEPVVPPA